MLYQLSYTPIPRDALDHPSFGPKTLTDAHDTTTTRAGRLPITRKAARHGSKADRAEKASAFVTSGAGLGKGKFRNYVDTAAAARGGSATNF